MISRVASTVALALMLSACGSNDKSDTGSADGEPAAVAAEKSDGEKLFAKCSACHTVDGSKRNGIGPGLHGIAGRSVASAEGFNYSAALKAKGGTWDDASLDAYLAAPAQAIPGNRMMFAGIKDAAQRKVLIDYLKAQK